MRVFSLFQKQGERLPKLQYRSVVVDESQDFHNEEWKLIRALVPAGANDLFLVGDAHQRIYGRKVVLSRCGIAIQGRSSSLRINYRTTEQIRAWAVAMVEGMAVDDLDGEEWMSLGPSFYGLLRVLGRERAVRRLGRLQASA